jgi:hypothetical protein
MESASVVTSARRAIAAATHSIEAHVGQPARQRQEGVDAACEVPRGVALRRQVLENVREDVQAAVGEEDDGRRRLAVACLDRRGPVDAAAPWDPALVCRVGPHVLPLAACAHLLAR